MSVDGTRTIVHSDGVIAASRMRYVGAYARSLSPVKYRWKLDANESVPPDAARFSINAELLCRYPSVGEFEMELAERLGGRSGSASVVVTAGGDDALYRLCMALLEPGLDAIVTTPSFEMIPKYARLAGTEPISVAWNGGVPFPTDDVLARITARTAAVFVVTPNNPTGAVASAEDLRRISLALRRRDGSSGTLIVDLAYTEFADVDLTSVALSLPNAVIVRTFSKAWGLAGLRVGYAAGPAGIINLLRASGNPYATSNLSTAIARQWWHEGGDAVRRLVDRVRYERGALVSLLKGLGTTAFASQGNFVLAKVADAVSVQKSLEQWPAGGIAIRRFPTDNPEHPLASCVRITCPGELQGFDELSKALTRTLSPAATLGRTPETQL